MPSPGPSLRACIHTPTRPHLATSATAPSRAGGVLHQSFSSRPGASPVAPLPPSPALYPMASGLPSFWFTLLCLQNIPGGPAPQTTQQYWHTLTSQRLSPHTSCLRWDSNRDSPSVPQASMRPGPDCSPWKSVTPKSTSLVTVWHRHHQLTATSLPHPRASCLLPLLWPLPLASSSSLCNWFSVPQGAPTASRITLLLSSPLATALQPLLSPPAWVVRAGPASRPPHPRLWLSPNNNGHKMQALPFVRSAGIC